MDGQIMGLNEKQVDKFSKGQARLWKVILDAEAGAQEMCDAGEFALSASLHRMAAHARMAYAEGRDMQSGGQYIARSGDK